MGAREMNIRTIQPALCNGDYLTARREYRANRLHQFAAIGMVANDKDFIAECELSGRDVTAAAIAIVRDQWTRDRYLSALNHTN